MIFRTAFAVLFGIFLKNKYFLENFLNFFQKSLHFLGKILTIVVKYLLGGNFMKNSIKLLSVILLFALALSVVSCAASKAPGGHYGDGEFAEACR